MKRLSYFSLFSLILLIPACAWMNNGRRRCCYPAAAPVCCPAAPAPACGPVGGSYAPAPSAYYDDQQAATQAPYTEGAYDETDRQVSAAPTRPTPVVQDQFAGDEDFDLDEDDQEIKALETKRSASAPTPATSTPATSATAADEDEDDTK